VHQFPLAFKRLLRAFSCRFCRSNRDLHNQDQGSIMLQLRWSLIAVFGTAPIATLAETIPMPPPRPAMEKQAVLAASPAVASARKEKGLRTCLATLLGQGIEAEAAPQPKSGNPGCHIDDPVRLMRIRVQNSKSAIALPDKPLLSCPFARTYALWLSGTAAPLLKSRLGFALTEIRTGPGFDCRNVNRAKAGKLSPHATGIAIDMDRFTFSNKQEFAVGREAGKRAEVLRALQNSACKDFTTVLGPGSDAAHAYHIHVDLKRHGKSGTYRICGERSGPFAKAK
jgi:hypothetical protein